jgi:hypothetical protein
MPNPLHQDQHGATAADLTGRDGSDACIALLVLGDELPIESRKRLLVHRSTDVAGCNPHFDRAGITILHKERRRVAPACERLSGQCVERDPLDEADRERLRLANAVPDDPGPYAQVALQRFDRLVEQGPRGHEVQGGEAEPRDGGRREDRLAAAGADVDDAVPDAHSLVDDLPLVVAQLPPLERPIAAAGEHRPVIPDAEPDARPPQRSLHDRKRPGQEGGFRRLEDTGESRASPVPGHLERWQVGVEGPVEKLGR